MILQNRLKYKTLHRCEDWVSRIPNFMGHTDVSKLNGVFYRLGGCTIHQTSKTIENYITELHGGYIHWGDTIYTK